MNASNENIDLIKKAISGDRAMYNNIFEKYQSTLEEFFCIKIFNKKLKEMSTLDGMLELCKKTFTRALGGINSDSFDLKENCLKTAEEIWLTFYEKIKKGDREAFKELFIICRKPLLGFLLWRLRYYSGPTEVEEILNDAYIQVFNYLEKNLDKGDLINNQHSIYSNLKYMSNIKNLARRIYDSPREIPFANILMLQAEEDDLREVLEQNVQEDMSTPEQELIYKEEIRELIEKEKRLFSAKLATIELCAFCSKPHQFLAFGFNKCLKWNPAKIAQLHTFTLFDALSRKLIDETDGIVKDKQFTLERDLPISFEPFLRKLEKRTNQFYPENENPLLCEQYGFSAIKTLSFNLFYEVDPSKGPKDTWKNWDINRRKKYKQKISDWVDKARKSTMNGLGLREDAG